MYIVPNPIEVKAMDDYKIYIKFQNGEERIFDMKEKINKKYYQKLKDYKYFKDVKISQTGITIEWKDGEDVAPENLYYDSNVIKNK